MKAAILERIGAPLIVDEVSVPALSFGQVLVRIYASGICGKQLGEIAGSFGPDKFLPHLMGHEGGGVVVEIGPGVTRVHPGDHVVLHWRKGAGIESACPKYKRGDEVIGGGRVTTFSEYSVVSENRLTVIDEPVPHEIAALMGCAVTTGLGVVFNDAQLKPGQSIGVIGCGGVGLCVIMGAKLAGSRKIGAFDIDQHKLWMAHALGANGLANIKDDPSAIRFLEGYNVIVDTTGDVDLIAQAYHLVAPGGKVIMVGQPKRGMALILPDVAGDFKGKTLMDSAGGQTSPNEDIPRYLRLYRNGLLNLAGLITHRFPLDQVNEALDVVRSGVAGRVMLEMS
jgi:S-(hydroxymethyl)glutathione dehydrogenase / alcohol dehydrogenase